MPGVYAASFPWLAWSWRWKVLVHYIDASTRFVLVDFSECGTLAASVRWCGCLTVVDHLLSLTERFCGSGR